MAKAIPDGSLILVTGMTGFVGAHIGNELWSHGFKIRGAVRSVEKGEKIQQYADKEFGNGMFEFIVIQDFTSPGAFDEAVKGVAGIVHAAMSVDPVAAATYEESIRQPVEGALSILRSAAAHGGADLKRIVITSSSSACGSVSTASSSYQFFDSDSWNIAAAERCKRNLSDSLYAATKYESEIAAWKWVKENKPQFVLNTTLPTANFGPSLPFISSSGSTYNWVAKIAQGDYAHTLRIQTQYFTDVRDTAIVHRIALTEPSVENERLWLATAPYTWNVIIALVAHFKPGFKPQYLSEDKDKYGHTFIDNRRTREAIRRFGGREELRSLDETVRDNIEGLQ